MKCGYNEDFIRKFLNNTLDSDEKTQFEKHLSNCEKCNSIINEESWFSSYIDDSKKEIKAIENDNAKKSQAYNKVLSQINSSRYTKKSLFLVLKSKLKPAMVAIPVISVVLISAFILSKPLFLNEFPDNTNKMLDLNLEPDYEANTSPAYSVIVIPATYDDVEEYSENIARVMVNEKYGFIDNTGANIVNPVFEDALDFSEGLAAVKLNGKWGCIDSTGATVIDHKFDSVGYFKEGLACIRMDKKYGYIDTTGEVVIPAVYDSSAQRFSDGLAWIREGDHISGKYGFIDKKGNLVTEVEYDYVKDFRDGLAPIRIGSNNDGKFGYINTKGEIVVKPKYQRALILNEGMGLIRLGDDRNGKWGFIDYKGNVAVEPQYDLAMKFNEGLAAVRTNGKWGFIDKAGNIVISPQFDRAGPFRDGLSCIEVNEKYGYIDKTGNVVIQPQFDHAKSFKNGCAEALIDGVASGLIDKSGKFIINYEKTVTPEKTLAP